MKYKNICVHNGRIWEKSALHLKSAIPGFNRRNMAKCIALDLLIEQVA
ncbi:hypothetical protein J4219_00430 [Candidatus Woesearchaeota archaeon]|nr:hypothetical protein [Candidatus Woesearchaeota archaeon]